MALFRVRDLGIVFFRVVLMLEGYMAHVSDTRIDSEIEKAL